MSTTVEIASRAASPFIGWFNRTRLGFPSHYFCGTGGIGDDLMSTAVFRELKKRGAKRIAMATNHPGLFEKNPDLDEIVFHSRPRIKHLLRKRLPFVRLGYADYDPVRDVDEHPDEHMLARMCRIAGIGGSAELRPYLFLTAAEKAAGKFAEQQIVMHSTGLAAAHAMRNKEWYPARFQEICARLSGQFAVVQLGSTNDPKLEGAMDLRGKTTLRQSAAILANSITFIGLVGFLMHLARAVDCRAVIVYGGRESPAQTGYIANKNLYSPVACAPCWQRNICGFDHKCMDMITVDQVVAAATEQIGYHGQPLPIQVASI